MKPYYNAGVATVWQVDVLAWALWYKAEIDAGRAEPFHAIVTDPPYALGATPPIEKLLAAWLVDDEFEFAAGFMNKDWDVMPGPQIWRALLDIVYPGGYLFAFSGTRTADLLGISCRLGGWEPFDRVTNFQWVYASGFPKSHAIGKALDASAVVPCPDCQIDSGDGLGVFDYADYKGITFDEAVLDVAKARRQKCETCGGTGQVVGVEREVTGLNIRRGDKKPYVTNVSPNAILGGGFVKHQTKGNITAPATPLAQAFDGYGTALKPSGEPVLLFRKPRAGRTFAQCAREFGSGGLDISSCRVKTTDNEPNARQAKTIKDKHTNSPSWNSETCGFVGTGDGWAGSAGRWPPNTHFSHVPPHSTCPTCHGEGCDECHGVGMVGGCVRVGSKRVRGAGGHTRHNRSNEAPGNEHVAYSKFAGVETGGYSDADSLESVAAWRCVDGCPVRALDEMAGERKSGGDGKDLPRAKCLTYTIGDQRRGGQRGPSTGSASRFYPCHDWHYEEIAERLAGETPFFYAAKASRGEREAGLDKLEIIMVQLSQDSQAGSGGQQWQKQDQNLRLLVDTEQLHARAIDASAMKEDTEWSMLLFGKGITDLSPQDIVFTTKTGTSSTTQSKTLNLLVCSLTSDCTQDVKFEMANGGSHVESVTKCNISLSFTSGKMVFLPGVGSVASGTRWKISASEKLAKEKTIGQFNNFHNTVKPLAVAKWFTALCKPPDQFKPRICIPFAGSGSEAIGALLAGWTEIHAIEREQEYCEIAAARIAWWSKWAKLTGKADPAEIRKLGEAAEAKEQWQNDDRQRSMFEYIENE